MTPSFPSGRELGALCLRLLPVQLQVQGLNIY